MSDSLLEVAVVFAAFMIPFWLLMPSSGLPHWGAASHVVRERDLRAAREVLAEQERRGLEILEEHSRRHEEALRPLYARAVEVEEVQREQ